MDSIVLELKSEVLNPQCDIVNVLRKAHTIAEELNLVEFRHKVVIKIFEDL